MPRKYNDIMYVRRQKLYYIMHYNDHNNNDIVYKDAISQASDILDAHVAKVEWLGVPSSI